MLYQFLLINVKMPTTVSVPGLKVIKVSKGAKIRNRYNQLPHLTQNFFMLNSTEHEIYPAHKC